MTFALLNIISDVIPVISVIFWGIIIVLVGLTKLSILNSLLFFLIANSIISSWYGFNPVVSKSIKNVFMFNNIIKMTLNKYLYINLIFMIL